MTFPIAITPAFPLSENYPRDQDWQSGLTKREYAAIAIMAAMCSTPGWASHGKDAAQLAVTRADSLMAALERAP